MTCKINCCKDCSLTLVPNHWIFLMLTSFWTLVKLEITVLTSSTNYCCLNWNQCQLNLQVLEYEMHWLLLCPIEQKPICLCRVPITSSLVYFAITTLTILSSKVSEIFLPPCLGHFVLANFKAVLWKLEKKNSFPISCLTLEFRCQSNHTSVDHITEFDKATSKTIYFSRSLHFQCFLTKFYNCHSILNT